MRDVTEALHGLSAADKRDLLARLLERDRDGAAGMSLDQRRLWFLRQLEPGLPTHVTAAWRIRGPLDPAVLQRCVSEVARRHDVLRTGFVELEGRPLRVRMAQAWLPLAVVDLSGLPPDGRERETGRLAARDAREPFDLAAGGLARLTLARHGPGEHVLLVTAHQLAADQPSLRVLARELAAIYDDAAAGRRSPLPEPTAQFADAVAQERARLRDGAAMDEKLAWWRARLAGVPVLQLPTDQPRPPVRVSAVRGGRRATLVPGGVAGRLTALAAEQGARPAAALLAAFTLLLGRAARQDDLAVGWPVTTRPDPGWGDLIGPFTNVLVLRADLSGRPSFRTLVGRAEQSLRGALAYRDVPFERLVEALQPRRDTSNSPLFQVMLTVDEAPPAQPAGAALDWAELDLDPGIALFDLTMRLTPARGGWRAQAEHSTDLWGPASVDRLLGSLVTLLTSAVERPDDPAATLPMLTAGERAQVTEAWNRTSRPFPADRCLHRLVEARAAARPDAEALVCGPERRTYRRLDQAAERLAARLRTLGVGPEILVGVLADRSIEAVTCLLAVLKAGGAYLPLDPASPPRRLRFLLDDAGARVVLGRHALTARLPLPGRVVVALDGDAAHEVLGGAGEGGPATPCRPGPVAAGPGNLAYCISTSGSTGQPKGVLVTHRQIVHSTTARSAVFPRPIGAYLMLAPLFFDASCAGLWWTLAEGGRLVLPTDREVEDARVLTRLIEREAVTHFDSVPSQYAVLLEAQGGQAPAPALAGLRCCVLAGEALPPGLVERHHRAVPGAGLFNEYGATEVTVWSSVHRCPPDLRGPSVPVGRPIPNARTYVLDDELEPVGIGLPGQVHIGGEGVARGYLHRPALTAERFVPDPFGPPGSRLYRIGDLGRWRPDGSLEFLGRADAQVKVRGFRVEPGEVEAVLGRHPDVAATAVAARPAGGVGGAGDLRLVAWVVPQPGRAPAADDLAAFLAERLPEYMLPAQFVPLEKLPLTSQGKVDRAALPDPGRLAPGAAAGRAAGPRTPVEKGVARIFADVLGTDDVGAHDDFFRLGGNSLHLARLGARLSITYDIDIPVHQFFSLPTVAGVAAMVELYRREGREGVLATRDPADVAAEAVLDPAITPDGLPPARIIDPAAVLLTGATGYLGTFLLERLLADTRAEVHCLVRAAGEAEALRRLEGVARAFRVPLDDRAWARVRPVVGDLAKPRLGLGPAAFERLARSVDVIVHNGALVNFTFPYAVLKPPNVLGTQEVLRLACTATAKAVHYVSTMDVLIGSHTPRPFLEVDLPAQPLRVPFSYPESKWVAERLVTTARGRGVPVAVYRPGMMMGHSQTGACHETDYLLVGLRGFLDLGTLPEFPEIMNSVTIDYASRAIVHLLGKEASLGRTFHLWNLHAVPTMQTYEWVRSFGYDFDVVPYDTALERAMALEPDHPLYPLLPVLFLYRSGEAGTNLTWEDHLTIDGRAECANLLAGLDGAGIRCPPLDERWMHMCLSFLIESGWLAPPARRAAARPRSKAAATPVGRTRADGGTPSHGTRGRGI